MKEQIFQNINDNNINEYFLNSQKKNLVNNINIIDPQDITDKYFVESKEKLSKINVNIEKYYFCISRRIYIICFLIILSFIFFFVKKKLFITIIILDIAIFIFIIICCYKNILKRLEIIKEEKSENIIFNTFNFFNCLNKKLKLTNIHFYIGLIYDERENKHFFNRLFIMKNFENSPEIDLNLSNVKTTPLKLFYYFDHILISNNIDIEKKLNELVGIRNYECPFKFDVNKYMNDKLSGKKERNIIQPIEQYSDKTSYSQYMKFCDRFFCYYIEKPFSDKKDDILRIDIIYSNDFEKMFIGLVNNNEKSYKNTFEFNMPNIDKFVLQKISYEYGGFYLKVIYKDKTNQLIYSLKKSEKENLRGLIYILNERINIINNVNKMNEINEDNPPPIASNEI